MVVMNNEGDIFDERRKKQRRKVDCRRKNEKDIMLDRREDCNDRRVGGERRKKNINE